MYQLGLCERELQNVLNGSQQQIDKKVAVTSSSAGGAKDTIRQKAIEKDDVCPICQEEIYRKKKNLIFCRYNIRVNQNL